MKTITHYVTDQDFELTFEPVEDTLTVKETDTGFEVRYLTQDSDPIDPRENDNLGTMTCFHGRYTLGDKNDLKSCNFDGWSSLKEHLNPWVCMPLYLLDHSGLHIRTGSFSDVDPGCWDSGQVGFIHVSAEKVKKEYGNLTNKTRQKVLEVLQAEVNEYDSYLSGDVWCVVKETFNKDKTPINHDIVGGYIGFKYAKEGLNDL